MIKNYPERAFSEVVTDFIAQSGLNLVQLARLSGVPRMTLLNWREGQVKKPRFWQDVIKLAKALHLEQYYADVLLQASGYPPVTQLSKQTTNASEQELLSSWLQKQPSTSTPFQVIRDLATFVGRQPLLEALESQLKADFHPHIYVIEGACGIGKTVVAARLAYQLRTHFTDGILWARPDLSDLVSILQQFANAFGLEPAANIDISSLSATVRGALAEKKVLVVLDNVPSLQEIEPLLPPSGRCAVLITTRERNLLGLAAQYFSLLPFTPEEAISLFSKALGTEQVEREEGMLLKIAEAVGFLPLAIDIAACRLVFEDLSAKALLERLQSQDNSLDSLNFCERSVSKALEASFGLLPANEQQFIKALAVFCGHDFNLRAAATSINVSLEEANNILGHLFSLGFVRLGQSENSYRLIPITQSFIHNKTKPETP